AQPDFADLTGSISAAQYTAATDSSIGAVRPDGVTTSVSNGVMTANPAAEPYALNTNEQYVPKWRKALASGISGTANATILFMGDSQTIGLGALAATTTPANNIQYSYPFQMARSLANDFGVPASWQSFMGDGSATNPNSTQDFRITV